MAPKKLVKQALPIRYTNKRLLIETLVKLFGEGNFELDWTGPASEGEDDDEIPEDHCILHIPRKLTKQTLCPNNTKPRIIMPSDSLRLLRDDLTTLERNNYLGEKFIPAPWLPTLLTEETIHKVVYDSDIVVESKDDVYSAVIAGARQIFATLVYMDKVNLLLDFTRSDNYRKNMDGKLPMDKEVLEKIFRVGDYQRDLDALSDSEDDDENGAKQSKTRIALQRKVFDGRYNAKTFQETQYVFIAPSFPQTLAPRSLPIEIRLPFTDDKPGPEGNFGVTCVVKLPPPEYTPDETKDIAMVRKELKSVESAVYEDELRCLRILAKIKDPNIVELYGFYTYNYKHNFLFRKADDKDLDHFLRKKNRPKEFKSEETYYFAMCGLASGLKALHNHRNDELNLEMIGCHRDLKPNNILVDSGKFILADFGLSTIKKSTYSSKSMSRDRNDDYRAPESEDFQTGETFEVGRASDIWSLGAILAVVFAYMKSGPDGVKKFREKRKLKLLTYMNTPETMALFHGGLGKSNPGVVDWISEMQDGLSKAEKEWLDLVERMLRLTGRPDIDEVLWKLRFATLKKVCEPIEAVLSTTPHLEHSVPEIAEIAEIPHSIRQYLEFEIEAETFKTWLLKLDEYKIETEEALKKEETFSQLISTLRELKEYLGALENAEKNPYPVFSLFRLCNEQLLSPLSPSLQESIREDAELEVSKAARDDEQLQKLLQMLAKPGAKTRLLTLVTIKNMKDLTAAFGTTPPSGAGLAAPRKLARVDRELSANVKEVPTFRTGVLSKSLSPTARDVVVEELEYQGEWHDKSKELFDRMKNITRLPQQVSAPTFRALSCFGFYHDEGHHSFELVYEFPTGKSTSNSEVKQLNELFGLQLTHYNTPKGVVSLEDRFQLAHDLAATVFAFRKFGWLHKNISSYNVLFFVDTTRERNPEVPFKADLKNPYVIGFSHSRPDESTQISTKMRGKGKILYAYQHPSYGGIENPMARYVPEYDYYSLGLVLLEIGLWNSLEKMTPLHDSPPRKTIRDFIRDRRVPFLVGTMGETYQDAVEACLFGGLSTAGGDVDKNFQRMVVERLRACLPDKR